MMSLHCLKKKKKKEGRRGREKKGKVIEPNDKMGQDKIRFRNHFLFCKWVSTQTVHNRYFSEFDPIKPKRSIQRRGSRAVSEQGENSSSFSLLLDFYIYCLKSSISRFRWTALLPAASGILHFSSNRSW